MPNDQMPIDTTPGPEKVLAYLNRNLLIELQVVFGDDYRAILVEKFDLEKNNHVDVLLKKIEKYDDLLNKQYDTKKLIDTIKNELDYINEIIGYYCFTKQHPKAETLKKAIENKKGQPNTK